MAASVAWSAEQQPLRIVDKPMTKEEARFRALDQNGDSRLSDVEFRADPAVNLELVALDGDNDGFLSMSEYVSRPIPPAKKSPKP